MIYSRIVGTGSYLPVNVVSNDELARRVDTSDEWIRARTGIRQRHLADPAQKSSDLAYESAVQALRPATPLHERLRDYRRHFDARLYFSKHGLRAAGKAGQQALSRVRRAGGVFRLRLCTRHCG